MQRCLNWLLKFDRRVGRGQTGRVWINSPDPKSNRKPDLLPSIAAPGSWTNVTWRDWYHFTTPRRMNDYQGVHSRGSGAGSSLPAVCVRNRELRTEGVYQGATHDSEPRTLKIAPPRQDGIWRPAGWVVKVTLDAWRSEAHQQGRAFPSRIRPKPALVDLTRWHPATDCKD